MAITFVQAVISTEGSAPPANQTTITNTAGNVLVAILGNEGGTISSVTDTLGNTWTPFPQQTTATHNSRAFYCLNCKGGSNTITANLSVGSLSFCQLSVAEWNPGAGNVFALDTSVQGLGSGSPDTGPALTTTQATALVIATFDDSNLGALTAGGGFTLRTPVLATTRCGIMDRIVSVTGSYQPAVTAGAQARAWTVFDLFPSLIPPVSTVYSVPDCRVAPFGPNSSRTVQGTKIYDVQISDNASVPGKDSRSSVPADSRVSPNIPQNSRAPGTFGPGE